ncbi:MAG: VWA domain-containing protein [Chloroflexi bacterium]|nr:VWA domain-containing protein [Chloroflexota bacterium]
MPLEPEPRVLDRVLAELEDRHGSLSANLVQFATLLKAAEVDLTTGQIIAAGQALGEIDIALRGDVRQALASSLLTQAEDRAVFDVLFDRFWRSAAPEEEPRRPEPETLDIGEQKLGMAEALDIAYARSPSAPPSETPPQSYSAEHALVQKDFANYQDDDVRAARRYLRRLAPKLATATVRRRRPARAGRELDLRRSLRRASTTGGEVVRLLRKRRKIRRLNLVLLCDVSGSMDVYSRFLTQFLYGLQNELRGVSTFVFSTRLFDVTPMLRAKSFEAAFERIGRRVEGWSGGTRIGGCLADFNRTYGRARIGPRTVVIIISDGWDRGDIDVLRREMRMLKRRAFRILWLNPLLGAKDYRPAAQGMAAALPWIDSFLPVHNLASLSRVGRELMSLARG